MSILLLSSSESEQRSILQTAQRHIQETRNQRRRTETARIRNGLILLTVPVAWRKISVACIFFSSRDRFTVDSDKTLSLRKNGTTAGADSSTTRNSGRRVHAVAWGVPVRPTTEEGSSNDGAVGTHPRLCRRRRGSTCAFQPSEEEDLRPGPLPFFPLPDSPVLLAVGLPSP